jgi:AcrR family transcriptional regulator
MNNPKKRAYNSTTRKETARLSRARILESAKLLFADKGYENTTIEQIAKDSEVSTPTIYALFKSKLGVLRAIMDECFPQSAHDSLVESGKHEKDPKKRISIAAKLARQIYDAEVIQSNLLQGAGVLFPELKQLEQEREERRYSRLSGALEEMVAEKLIDENLDHIKALDIFWAFTGRDLYRLFVIERKWSSDDYEAWLADTLAQMLLKKDLSR